MTSRSEALVSPPSWGRAPRAPREHARPWASTPALARAPVRWGIRAAAASDVASGAAILAATAGLWAAFLLAAW